MPQTCTHPQDTFLPNDATTFKLSGGNILSDVFVQDSSILNVFGTGLGSVRNNPNFEWFGPHDLAPQKHPQGEH